MPAPSSSSRCSADPPKIANQTSVKRVGMVRTVKTNSRMVRPREMRAMKSPTNGDHEIHHAQ
jgi:hypothetical protein